MYIHHFNRKYGLNLTPTADTDISLGDLVWPHSKKRHLLSRKGLHNNIYNIFLTENIVNERQWREAMSFFESDELEAAKIPVLQIEVDQRFTKNFYHPLIKLLQSEPDLLSAIKISFNTIQTHTMTDEWRMRLKENITKMRPQVKKRIFACYHGSQMITEMYYGTIRLEVDGEDSFKMNSFLDAHQAVKPVADFKDGQCHMYEFEHQYFPFAMRLKEMLPEGE